MVVTLKIQSCLDCPHHDFEHDPSSGDSFDWQDDALVCKKTEPSQSELASRLRHADPPGRIIVGASRNASGEYKRNGAKIPKWCPLR